MTNNEFVSLMISKSNKATSLHLNQLQLVLEKNVAEAYNKAVGEIRTDWESGGSRYTVPDADIWNIQVFDSKRSEDSADEYNAFAESLEEELEKLAEEMFFTTVSKAKAEEIVESLEMLAEYNFLSAQIDLGCGLTYNEVTFVSAYNHYNQDDQLSTERFTSDF